MVSVNAHKAYIAAACPLVRPSLLKLHNLLSCAIPGAEEVMVFKIPSFKVDGLIVAAYASTSKSCHLFLLPGAISQHFSDIAAAGVTATQSRITFSPQRPIPDDLVERLASASVEGAFRSMR